EQENADNGQADRLVPVDADPPPAPPAPPQHEQPGNGEARSSHHFRGKIANPDANAKIGRTPEEVDQEEGKNDLGSSSLRHLLANKEPAYLFQCSKAVHKLLCQS